MATKLDWSPYDRQETSMAGEFWPKTGEPAVSDFKENNE